MPMTIRSQPRPGQGKWVLVAEDDLEMRRLVAATLRRDGFDILEAADGAEALTLLQRAGSDGVPAPCAIITDLGMPRCSGRTVVAVLHRSASSIPLFVITAFGDEETHESMRSYGVRAVFDKPFRLDELRRAVLEATG